MTTSDDLVLHECRDGVLTLTLNLARKLNPLSIELQRVLLEKLHLAEADDSVKVLVLTGAGKAFSVGADLDGMLSEMEASGKPRGDCLAEWMEALTNPLIEKLQSLRVPTIAAVNGWSAGAGVGLAMACDIVVATRSTSFFLPFVPKLGLVPDAGSSWFLPRRVGAARAIAMTLLGERISAEQAAAWGMVWACVDDQELSGEVLRLTQRLARLPEHGALEVRRIYAMSAMSDLPAQLRYERERQSKLIERPEFLEGVRAFLEKREPRFREVDHDKSL